MSKKNKKKSDWVSFKSLTPEEKQSLQKELENVMTAPLPLHIKKIVEAFDGWEKNEEFLRQFQEAIIKNNG